MDLVKINVVRLQAMQASLTLLDNVAAAVTGRVQVIIRHS